MKTVALNAIESAVLRLRSDGHYVEAQQLQAAIDAMAELFESSEILADYDYGRALLGRAADRRMHAILERHRAAVRRFGGAA